MTGLRPSVFTSPRQRRRKKASRIARISGAVLGVIAVVIVIVTLLLQRHAATRIEALPVAALGTPAADAPGPTSTDLRTTLVVTTDGVVDDATLLDGILLVQASSRRDRPAVLSFPIDLKVAVTGVGQLRLDEVWADGGADLLTATLRDYTGMRVDHFVEVDLTLATAVADAVGGVEICIDRPAVDREAGLELGVGCHVVNGTDADIFVRSRLIVESTGVDPVAGRIQRQHAFFSAVMREASSPRTFIDPFRARAVLDIVGRSVRTDSDLGLFGMVRFANSVEDVTGEGIEQRIVPSYFSNDTGFGQPYPEQAEAIFQALREGRPMPELGLTSPRELVPEDVQVQVLNGVGTEGLASEVGDLLAARGFGIESVGNFEGFGVVETLIAHGPGDEAKAALVARFFDGRIVSTSRLPAGVDVLVTIGEDATS